MTKNHCVRRPAFIFDFDGTLANSFDPAMDYLFDVVLPKHHLNSIKRQDLDKWRNKSIFQIARSLPFSFWKIPQIMLEVKKWHDENLHLVNLYPEVPAMIEKLNQLGYKLMILTSNSADNVNEVLSRYHLNQDFLTIKESQGIFNKPQALRNLLNDYELTVQEVIYVGDEIRDIRACQQTGIPIIAVTYGFNGAKGLKKNKPQYLVNSPTEIIAIAKEFCAKFPD